MNKEVFAIDLSIKSYRRKDTRKNLIKSVIKAISEFLEALGKKLCVIRIAV